MRIANKPPFIIKGNPFHLILEVIMLLCGIYLYIKDYTPVLGIILAILGVAFVLLRLFRWRNILTIDAEGIKVKDWIKSIFITGNTNVNHSDQTRFREVYLRKCDTSQFNRRFSEIGIEPQFV